MPSDSIGRLDLNGTWKLRWNSGQRGGKPEYATREQTDMDRYIDAAVPGEVHLDLWREGWIADPYVETNVLAARWVEEFLWSYRREFVVPARALRGRSWLVFQSLDLVATIYLNGREIGSHANVFHPCRIETTGKLRKGRNLLTVKLDSGLWSVADKPAEPYVSFADQRLHKRHWLRKPQSQFEWDWAPRLVNVGITGDVALEYTHAAARIDQLVPLAELSPDLRRGTVRVRLFVQGLKDKPSRGELTVEIVETGQRVTAKVQIAPGLAACETTVAVENPCLWWPVGHGRQHRYTVRATLRIDGQTIGRKESRIGFRHVRINQDPHPAGGRYFVIEINGRQIFAKGGNFAPADIIYARIDRDRYDRLTDRALEANFNCLRVWGGGLYESDDFYDLCDRKGILVWQEFIFACSRYPATDIDFHNSVRAEATHNIRRLACHPSLIVWCGNNENEWGCWEWGYDKSGAVLPDYSLFHLTLPRILAEEDPTRFYQPSSPFSPDLQQPNRDDVGDQHPWSVGFANTDFRDYRKMACRFPNEGGILGPTSLPTMLACVGEKDRKRGPQSRGIGFGGSIGSFAWQVHDNAIADWEEPSWTDRMIDQWLGRNIRKMTIAEFVYWGGLVQGEGLREYCDNFRRRMFDTSSAIFWMYNDTWPATRSWSIVDYYLRRNPSFWAVKRALAPISLVVAQEDGQTIVFGVNETQETVTGELQYGVFNLAGGLPVDLRANVSLAPNASTRLAEFPVSRWKRPKSSMAFAVLRRHGGAPKADRGPRPGAMGRGAPTSALGTPKVLARNRLFLPFFKEMNWPAAHVRVRVRAGQAVFTSRTFAWGVCLDLDGDRPLADNFFDVYPGIPHAIPWKGKQPPTILKVERGLTT